ncbi:hypothetical protein RJ639_007169 [Escallonia herrerae]|uniref:FAF domain-containing protein n=1 Tax=Escallonia herrerae TaxID=1293975 RepID=A0AA88VV06_9ASTE|nr:hypothetical protein RJ639_007169 [Escallonia herrerae]
MSAHVSKSFQSSSPIKVEEEAPKMMEKQGIVSILGSDCERTKSSSLRRTLSADMSSKKWLAQNGFSSPLKKIASSQQLPVDSSSSSDEDEEDIWRRIQQRKELERPGQVDVWGSILSQKADEDMSKLPPPYVHPLVKTSGSSLSEKSLEICTESLGSETGSDEFSSYPPSETGDVDEDKEEVQPQQHEKELQGYGREEVQVVKYNFSANKKSPPRSFPPPLPSLARSDGPSLHMHSHRQNGRLVLEAVSVSSKNFFQAQRQDGRLLLSLVHAPSEEAPNIGVVDQVENKVEGMLDVFEIFEQEKEGNGIISDSDEDEDEDEDVDEDEEEESKEMGISMLEQGPKLPSGGINVHRSAMMIKKLMGLDNKNRTWPHTFNKAAKLVEVEMNAEEPSPLPQSLPPPPRVARLIPSLPAGAAAAASFNAYEYFWRAKPTVAGIINQQNPPLKNKPIITYEQQDCLISVPRGCKERRRNLKHTKL